MIIIIDTPLRTRRRNLKGSFKFVAHSMQSAQMYNQTYAVLDLAGVQL